MKVVNMLKIYGYYDGCLVRDGMDKRFISGEARLEDIINSKGDFKELKMSVDKVLDYCYENNFGEIENVMNYFYKELCREIRKRFGGFFEKMG